MIKTETFLFWALFSSMVVLELLCAQLAYETIGEIMSAAMTIGIVIFNSLFAILARRSKLLAGVGVVLLALLIIPQQVRLGQRLWEVQSEANAIVGYVYEHRLDHGTFPADLAEYSYANPDAAQYIQDYRLLENDTEFMLLFFVGTDSTSHWYSSETGWGYYPD